MKRFLIYFACLAVAISCTQQPKRIVSSIPVKSNIMGIELGIKTNSCTIEGLLFDATGKFFVMQQENIGTGSVIRAITLSMDIYYGGASWSYIDVRLDENSKVFSIELVASYESLERAKDQFEMMSTLFGQKYGKGNKNGEQLIFWTDNINSVGVTYNESNAINGNDRSFCTVYYTNISLAEAFAKANTPDI